MTEIKIEKKKPIWPIVIVTIIILIAIYFLWFYNDQEMSNDPLEKDTISTVEELFNVELLDNDGEVLYEGNYGTIRGEQAIADYLKYTDDRTNRSTGDYYRSSFSKLIGATERVAELEQVDVSNTLSVARESSENISSNTERAVSSENIRKTADDVSRALRNIQRQAFANLSNEMAEVEEAVSDIDRNQSLDSENEDIREFFDKSAHLIGKMDRNNNQR